MTSASSFAPVGPFAAALLADRGIEPGDVVLAIDPHDEMLQFLTLHHQGDRDMALFTYFQTGLSVAEALAQVLRWRFGDLGRIGRLLDFASGYGRVTRFLLRHLPAERVWVADVYEGGVRFQERELGVRGVVSTVRPEDFACAGRFDAILVTSLFTHLPEARFRAWLRALCGLLAPGGMLLWSVHDQSLLAPDQEMPAGGLLFEETSESGSLDPADYGSAWVTEELVRRAVAEAAPGASVHRLNRGLCSFQDLYVTVLEPGVDFSGLVFRDEPELFLDSVAIEGTDGTDGLRLAGWAARRGHGRVREVQILLDGALLASCPVDGPRPEVTALLGAGPGLRPGWACSCRLPEGASRSAAVLMLRVADDVGETWPLWAGTIDSLLLRAGRQTIDGLKRELDRTYARIAGLEQEVGFLNGVIAAMRSTRFWKMRKAWFRVKRALGLTEDLA